MDGKLVIVFLGIILLIGFFIGHAVAKKSNGQSGILWGLGAIPDRMNEGEYIVHKALHRILDKKREVLFNNVTLTLADGSTTQIDHIFISTTGIFVIETKHYNGWIFADANSKQWMQTFQTSKHPFQNPIHQNRKHVKAVESIFDFLPKNVFHSIIVFSGDAEFKTSKPLNVIYANELQLHLKKYTDDVISINRVHFCTGRLLFKRLPNSLETDKLHVKNLNRRHADKQVL